MTKTLPPVRDQKQSGTMSAAIRAFDWASTPFGPIESWPACLRYAVSLCENSSLAVTIFWGPEYRLIYNDLFAKGPAAPHANALGVPAYEIFKDIWSTLQPQMAQVMATGKSIRAPEQILPTMREGIEEEVCWNYDLTPIIDDDGKILGIFSSGLEITGNVLADRRLSFQINLADRLHNLDDPEEMKRISTELLGQHLGALRIGYANVDPEGKILTVQAEWTRDQSIPSLVGRSNPVDIFGANFAKRLWSQEIIVIPDLHSSAEYADPRYRSQWDKTGIQAMILAPMMRRGELMALLYVHESEPRIWRRSEIEIVRDAAERMKSAVERTIAEKSLRESEDHYRHTVELNPQVSWTSLPNGQVNRMSPRWHEWTGISGLGDNWLEALHPEDRERSRKIWAQSIACGESVDIENRIKRRDGGYRWTRSRAFPRYDEKGNIILWYGSTEDIHEQKMAEELQRLLINELNHRVKNTLATVQAVAFQTMTGNKNLAEARAQFEARLLALSRAHNLLTEQSWEGAQLLRVATDAMEPLVTDQDRLSISGEPIWLTPRATLAFSLALHELVTNAAKYGALSTKTGRISITWTVNDDTLQLIWKESGGPPVTRPSHRGFGSRLIERGLGADLRGKAKLHFEKDGLGCTIEASREAIQAREEAFG